MNNALEIDFLPVGNNSKSGDAIALRFGNYENGQWKKQKVFVIDGGNIASGEALIKHVTEIYKTDVIERVILTHPDTDHVSGLRQVVKDMKVGKIWMHRPWNHWKDCQSYIIDKRMTRNSFNKKLQEAYSYAYELEQIAIEKKIEIFAPHQGASYKDNGEKILTILGPGKNLYVDLIRTSDKTPAMRMYESIAKSFSAGEKTLKYEDMSLETENLSEEDPSTSPENDMSLVLYLTVANKKILFTGDAGTMGLYNSIRYAISQNIDLKNLTLFDAPHHGSKNNISKGILDHIYAPLAIVSCATNGEPSHPSKIVTNSFYRRNITPYCTKGKALRLGYNLPNREGFKTSTPFPFQNYVEI